jgi:hypothetical protein
MPLSAVKRDIVIRNPRVAHSENTRMWAEKKLFAFLTTNSVPQPDPWRVRPGKSASRQLVQCIAAGWIPAWKGVYHSKSSPVATQHLFLVPQRGTTAMGRGNSTSPVCRANVRSYRARLRSYCSLAYSAFACLRMGMSGSASYQSVRKSW